MDLFISLYNVNNYEFTYIISIIYYVILMFYAIHYFYSWIVSSMDILASSNSDWAKSGADLFQMGQIRDVSDEISVHFARRVKMYRNFIWKSQLRTTKKNGLILGITESFNC